MDFIIIANAWSAGRDNPTSKHRIALELAARGHRVLWLEGSGMRAPSMGSGHDRLRMVKKVWAALRGARMVSGKREAKEKPHPEVISACCLWVLSPLFIPLPRYEMIRRLNGVICRWSLRYWGWRLGFNDPVLINYVPVLAEGMRGGASGKRGAARASRPIERTPRAIYHCVDRWDQFDMYDSAMMTEMDRRCCVYADLVIASSTDLYTRCRRLNPNTVMITHGVDWDHFRQAVSGKRQEESGKRTPVIGFFGLLSEWVDQELILKLAAEFSGATHPLPLQGGERGKSRTHPLPLQGGDLGKSETLSSRGDQRMRVPSLEGQGVGSSPHADIVLIGKADVPVTRLQGIANIHLLGPKPFAELPSHIAGFTVGVIPFVVNDLTRAVNPIKLREMLAAGCPVVSSALPEVEKFEKRGSVFVAHDADEFVAMVREAIAHPLTTEQRLALSDSMASETWAGKVEEILKWINRGRAIGQQGSHTLEADAKEVETTDGHR